MSLAQEAKQLLLQYKETLDKEMAAYFDRYIETNKDISPYSELILSELRSVNVRGGKRVRPSLSRYVYTLLGGKDLQNMLMAEIGLDINATYILIEDDFMDLSPLRRGEPTIHENISAYAKERFPDTKKDLVHFGHSQAVNIGLLAAHLAQKIILETTFDNRLKVNGLLALNEGNIMTAQGQILDIFGEINHEINEADIVSIMELKTAYYTFVNPLIFGAAFADADQQTKEMLTQFGMRAGVAFQIQDDILGMFGDEKKLGKPASSDLKEGKRTLLIRYALDTANPEQRQIIDRNLGNQDLTEEQLVLVRKVIVETGSLEKTKNVAQDYINEAKKIFETAKTPEWHEPSYLYLTGLIQYMIERDL